MTNYSRDRTLDVEAEMDHITVLDDIVLPFQAQLAGMLERVGFVDIQRLDFTGTNDSGLIRSLKPV